VGDRGGSFINVMPQHIVYVRHYPETIIEHRAVRIPIAEYFPVAKLPQNVESHIKLGDEGSEFTLITTKEYLTLSDAIPVFQRRVSEYVSIS
jgi:hypothetical protein